MSFEELVCKYLDDHCINAINGKVPALLLYHDFIDWCILNQEVDPPTWNYFAETIINKLEFVLAGGQFQGFIRLPNRCLE